MIHVTILRLTCVVLFIEGLYFNDLLLCIIAISMFITIAYVVKYDRQRLNNPEVHTYYYNDG